MLGFVVHMKAQNTDRMSSDTLLYYAKRNYQTNPKTAYSLSQKTLLKAADEKSELNKGRAYEMLGISLDYLGNLDSALLCFDLAEELLKPQADKSYLANVYTSRANSLFLLNRNEEALSYYVQSADLFKKLGRLKEHASGNMGIANVYSRMKFYDLSLKYYEQSLAYFEEIQDSVFMSYLLSNISEVYASQGKTEKELEYQRRSLRIKEQLQDDYGLVYSYTNMAGLMIKKHLPDSAYYFAEQAIKYSKKVDNQEFLSASYMAMADVYAEQKRYENAVSYYMQSLELAQQLKNTITQHTLLKKLSDVQMEMGDYKAAANTLLKFISVNDSINSVEAQKSFNELQTRFETEKKEKEISLLNERDKKRQLIIYSAFVVLVLLIVLSIVLYNRFRMKRKTAAELEIRNAEIHKQKHLVDEKQKEILDSINYARRIQFALLAHRELLNTHLPDHFILFQPKDIVSGDFYWATRKDNRFYFAVCDSTGHGVPGAFMSLLNISFLNEAINEKEISQPDEVFNFVRERLLNNSDFGQDGMDAILLCIEKNSSQNSKITYAAANNAPVLVSQGKLTELPKDKMPVGKSERKDPFTLFTINAEKGDVLYLYTDGYADQFGGPDGKKFKYKRLHELLISLSLSDCAGQQTALEKEINEWKGSFEQVDDICITGIKF